jgi:ferredoxin
MAIGGPLSGAVAASKAVPALSPLAAAALTIAQRRWFLALYWLAPPTAVLLLGCWKGRLFCRWICPLGTLYALPSRLSLHKRLLPVRLAPAVFWTILFASLVGAPLALFLDPLATFNRLTPLLSGACTRASWVLGLVVLALLILGAVQPMIWCTHLCPLGYCFELAHALPRKGPRAVFSSTRRSILAGVIIGLPLAGLARRFLFTPSAASAMPVLPPGAKDVETFAAVCTRCYACLNVCPTRIIQVSAPAGRALGQWYEPEVKYFDGPSWPGHGYCPESCTKCSQVCPTGALTPLMLKQKRQRRIGTARVIRDACLAWADGQYCMVCQEHCPYRAIESDEDANLVPRPVVKAETCRGCGFCHSVCPAVRAGKAIVIDGLHAQTISDDGYADLFDE